MNYSDLVLQHFFNPYHAGNFCESDTNHLIAQAGSMKLNGLIQFQIQIIDDHIVDARFKAFGNPYLIACGSYCCQWLEEKRFEILSTRNYSFLIELFQIPKTQEYCVIILEEALLNLYQIKSLLECNEYDRSTA